MIIRHLYRILEIFDESYYKFLNQVKKKRIKKNMKYLCYLVMKKT